MNRQVSRRACGDLDLITSIVALVARWIVSSAWLQYATAVLVPHLLAGVDFVPFSVPSHS